MENLLFLGVPILKHIRVHWNFDVSNTDVLFITDISNLFLSP